MVNYRPIVIYFRCRKCHPLSDTNPAPPGSVHILTLLFYAPTTLLTIYPLYHKRLFLCQAHLPGSMPHGGKGP